MYTAVRNEKNELKEVFSNLENQHIMLREKFDFCNNEKEQLKLDKANLEKINFDLEDQRVKNNIKNVELKIERDMLR